MRERRWRAFSTSSLATTRHVVDERTIDVGASEADGIEEDVCIRYKVLLVGEFVGYDLRIAGLAEHHQPTRYAYGFSSCASSHGGLYRPFLPRQPKVFCFEIDSTHGTFIHLLTGRQLDFRAIDPSSTDMIKPSARILVIQRITFVYQHHRRLSPQTEPSILAGKIYPQRSHLPTHQASYLGTTRLQDAQKSRQQSRCENFQTLYTSLKGSGRGCPLLRASNEHRFTVRVLRARRAPRHSPLPFSAFLP